MVGVDEVLARIEAGSDSEGLEALQLRDRMLELFKKERTMTLLNNISPNVSKNPFAAFLLVAANCFRKLNLQAPSSSQIIETVVAGKNRAYRLTFAVEQSIEGLSRTAGRPSNPKPETHRDTGHISRRVVEYIMENAGCVSMSGKQRRKYSDDFRCFIVNLWEKEKENIDTAAFAHAARIPEGTLKEWIVSSSLSGRFVFFRIFSR